MPLKVVTSLETLFHYAHELGKARMSGDEKRIEEAKRRHDDYVEVCLKADEMTTPFRHGDIR